MSCYSVLLLYAVHYDLPFDSSFRLVKKCQFLLYQLEMIYMDSKFKLQRNGGWSFYTSVPSCSQWKRCLHSLLLRHHQYRLLIDTNKYWILNIHWWIGVTPLNGSTGTASCQVKSYLHFWRTLILLAWCCQPGAASLVLPASISWTSVRQRKRSRIFCACNSIGRKRQCELRHQYPPSQIFLSTLL